MSKLTKTFVLVVAGLTLAWVALWIATQGGFLSNLDRERVRTTNGYLTNLTLLIGLVITSIPLIMFVRKPKRR